jgi:hypothetical protein
MFSFHRLARQSTIQFTVALIAAGSWLSGCGDDEEDGGGGNNKGGSSGSGGSTNGGSTNGGSAGSTNGGSTTGGSAGNPSGGNAGMPMGGSAGTPMGGSAGSAGTGTAGEGMGGEGMGGEGMGGEGMGGEGMGGEGGATEAMCATNDLNIMELNAMQQHNHIPLMGTAQTTLVNMINTGMPLVFTLPEDGSNPHQHTLTFTAQQLTTLRNDGSIAMMTTSSGGPAMNMHTHTYSLSCAP